MFRKIQSSIFSYFFTIVILALFILIVFVNSILTRFEKQAVEERLTDVTLTISDYLYQTIKSNEETAVLLTQTLEKDDLFKVNELINKDTTSSRLKELSSAGHTNFTKLKNQLTQFQKILKVESVLLLNDEKVLVASHQDQLVGKLLNDNELENIAIQKAISKLKNNNLQWIDLKSFKPSKNNKRFFLLVKVPHSMSGNYYALYVYNPNTWEINKEMNNRGEVKTSDLYLIGKDGKLRSSSRLFNENPSAVLLMLSNQGISETELSIAKENNSIIGLMSIDSTVLVNSNKEITVMSEAASVNGINALMMTHWIQTNGLDWRIVIEWDKEKVFSEWYEVRFYINAIFFTIGLFLLISVVYGGRKLAKPIYALKNALDDLVDLPLTFEANKYEEMGISSDMLQKMDLVSNEIKNLNNEKRSLENEFQSLKGINENIEHELNKSHQTIITLEENKKTQETDIHEANLLLTEHLTSVKRVLKMQMYDSSLFQLSISNLFHIHKAKKDISGDFICTYERDSRVFFFLGDTGKNDIKAALGRMVITSIINDIVNVKRLGTSNRILEAVNKALTDLKKKDEIIFDVGVKLSVCIWDRQKQMLEFAGAQQSIFVLRDDNFDELHGDDLFLGEMNTDQQFISNTHYLPLNRIKKAQLYLFTDGLINQLNPEKESFGQSRLKELIIDVNVENIEAQKEYIEKTFIEWKGGVEQNDDVSILGLHLI